MQIGTVVWAKLTSYPFWPGRVTQLRDVEEKTIRAQLTPPQTDSELIWFFGSRNYAWVPTPLIEHYRESYETHTKSKKARGMKTFQMGLKEAENWIKKHPNASSDNDQKNLSPQSAKKEKRKRLKTERDENHSHDRQDNDVQYKEDEEEEEEEEVMSESPEKKRKSEDEGSDHKRRRDQLSNSTLELKDCLPPKLSPALILKAVASLTKHPVSKYHKLEIVKHSKGFAEGTAQFSDIRKSSQYEVYSIAGSLYYLIDLLCYCALLRHLRENETALTQDLHVTPLSSVAQGAQVTVKATLVQSKVEAGLHFLTAEVFWKNQKVATAQILKSTLLECPLPVSSPPSSPSRDS